MVVEASRRSPVSLIIATGTEGRRKGAIARPAPAPSRGLCRQIERRRGANFDRDQLDDDWSSLDRHPTHRLQAAGGRSLVGRHRGA